MNSLRKLLARDSMAWEGRREEEEGEGEGAQGTQGGMERGPRGSGTAKARLSLKGEGSTRSSPVMKSFSMDLEKLGLKRSREIARLLRSTSFITTKNLSLGVDWQNPMGSSLLCGCNGDLKRALSDSMKLVLTKSLTMT